jgi:perosamine synthetase
MAETAQPDSASKFLPYGRQWVDDEDIQAVEDTLRRDWITQGQGVADFEADLAAYCGASYAVAVSSGTAALHLGCMVLGISPHKAAITSPLTFSASANCVAYCGGRPDFADIRKETLNIDPDALRTRLSEYPYPDDPSVIIPVHFGGQPCDMEALARAAHEHGLGIIEDASHALGSSWQDREGTWHRVGSCSHSDLTVFSFHPVKHITTGEGGAVLTNDEELYHRLCELRSHGVTRDPEKLVRHEEGPWYYEMQSLGYNYRITDFQCELGRRQLKKADHWVNIRRKLARRYEVGLDSMPWLEYRDEGTDVVSSYHLFTIRLRGERGIQARRAVFEALRASGVGVQVHYVPVHSHPYYEANYGYTRGMYPVAEDHYSRCMSLPLFPKMEICDVDYVLDTLRDCASLLGNA